MQNKLLQVKTFLRAMGKTLPGMPRDAKPANAELAKTLIMEEFEEYEEAAVLTIDHFDALVDLLYVALNGYAYLAINPEPHLIAVTCKQPTKFNLAPYVAQTAHRLIMRPLCIDECKKSLDNLVANLVFAAGVNNFNLDAGFDIVHASNMTKLWTKAELATIDQTYTWTYTPALDLYTVKRPDGKVVKPPSFRPPDLTDLVNEARRSFGLSPVATAPSSAPSLPQQPDV